MQNPTPEKTDPVSFAVKAPVADGSRNSGGTRREDRPLCSYCQRSGHAIDTCYRLHGFPARRGADTTDRGRGKGGRPDRGRGGAANATAVQTVDTTASSMHVLGDADKVGLENLSAEDWLTLKSLLSTHKSTSSHHLSGKANLQWLFDTGALHHMTGVVESFSEVWNIPPYPVKLPNGEQDRTSRILIRVGNLINRTPTPFLDGKTPFEVLFGKALSLNNLRVFGCLCYAHSLNRDRDKFTSRSRKCVFVGYLYAKKGWRLYDLDTGVLFESRDVVFIESELPFSMKIVDCDISNAISTPHAFGNFEEEAHWLLPSTDREGHRSSSTSHSERVLEDIGGYDNGNRGNTTEPEVVLGRGQWQRYSSVRLQDYVTHTARLSPSPAHSSSTESTGTPYPISHYGTCNQFSLPHCRFLAAITAGRESSSYSEAVRSQCWRDAMKEEIKALEANGTWTIEELPKGKKALGSK
ncbi:uncharacterized protein [Coffea arabica]|uniref:Retroviral polymerase SH3-like domain-containing protein n=1 Tax=Coffea arabica TaxID=13443 RepID=A0ABM4VU65_COFAR